MRLSVQNTLIEDALTDTARAVDGYLARLLSAEDMPPRLEQAMRHALLGGGKRLRPFLLRETARLFGVQDERPLHVGAALEALHCYSLVHDDLPAMDNDQMRRGQPCVHIAFDEATAILAGDGLLTIAFAWLADVRTHLDAQVRVDLIALLARASGGAGMVGGQMLDLAAEGRFEPHQQRLSLKEQDILHLQSLKTGALFSFAVEAGAILGGANAAEHSALSRFATALGRAFQLKDDLLDVSGDATLVGKALGKDASAGKATLIDLYGVEGATARLHQMVDEAKTALIPFGTRAGQLHGLIDYLANRNM